MISWISTSDRIINSEQGFTAIIPGPHCKLGIQSDDSRILGIEFLSPEEQDISPKNGMAEEAVVQITRWLNDPEWDISLPLIEMGTVFQRKIWRALLEIKPGQPKTYGEVAREIGSGARAVGNACRANPYPVIVPCHRIIAANGLGGFAGERRGMRLDTKRWLLAHEGYKANK
ncbi:MAG: cysteine methyltransferase [Gammaproteobacteria bacterium]|nr:MAG: cysteine methyltransferase [Gammaproteobacteria bacterium]RLA23220.1 MAG: cysteine methyltransferase [Gammaproteobacteria bacterium]